MFPTSARMQVEVRHGRGGGNKRGYKVKGLTENAADDCYFENDAEGKRMSVADYFTQSYGIKCASCVDLRVGCCAVAPWWGGMSVCGTLAIRVAPPAGFRLLL